MRILILATALLTLAPPPAQAAGTFSPPQGCTTWMTVQARQCRVSQYYKCTADTPGDQWRADFDQEGMFFVSRIDAESQWVESYDVNPPVRQTLDPNPEDPASFSDLLGGVDTFAFDLSKDDGRRSRVRGFDRLTGKSVVIDGITLQQTEFEFEERDPDGTLLRRSKGNEYIHPDWRTFFAGPSLWDGGDGEYLPMDGSPVEFVFPGEPGFAVTEPLFECDAVLSALPLGVIRVRD
ncbi:MAG: hypothetical protein ACT4OK_21775 [Gemmobacter sp.]